MGEVLVRELTNEGVLTLTIDRPEVRNAINFQLIKEFDEAIDMAVNEPSVKLIVIRGAGERAFCSGGDLSEFHALHTDKDAFRMLSQMGEVLYKLATCSKPTIAYLNGHAVGGGCEIATACDIRVVKEGAKLGFVQGNQAITTGWGAGTLLMEKIPSSQALYLLYSASIIQASEAKELGFVTEIIQTEEEFLAYLKQFSDKQLGVLQAYKQILIRKWETVTLRERIMEEIKACSKLWEKDEHLAAVEGFRNKR